MGVVRLELTTYRLKAGYSTDWVTHPQNGEGGIWTHEPPPLTVASFQDWCNKPALPPLQIFKHPYLESNQDYSFRRAMFCPLNYTSKHYVFFTILYIPLYLILRVLFEWWEVVELNHLHLGLQPNALPVELTSRNGGGRTRTYDVSLSRFYRPLPSPLGYSPV